MPKKIVKVDMQQALFEAEGKDENLDHIKIEDDSKKHYYEVKGAVIVLEEKNNDRVYLFPSSTGAKGEWYRVGGRSALFYKYFLGPRMGRRDIRIRKDTDTRMVFRHGVAAVHQGDRFMRSVEKLGYEVRENRLGVIVVELEKTFTAAEIKNMGETARSELEQVQLMLTPAKSMPGLYAKMRGLARALTPKVKKLHPAYRETLGNKMLDATAELFVTYFRVANGVQDESAGGKELMMGVNRLAGLLAMVDEIELFDPVTRTRFGEWIIEIKEEVEKLCRND